MARDCRCDGLAAASIRALEASCAGAGVLLGGLPLVCAEQPAFCSGTLLKLRDKARSSSDRDGVRGVGLSESALRNVLSQLPLAISSCRPKARSVTFSRRSVEPTPRGRRFAGLIKRQTGLSHRAKVRAGVRLSLRWEVRVASLFPSGGSKRELRRGGGTRSRWGRRASTRHEGPPQHLEKRSLGPGPRPLLSGVLAAIGSVDRIILFTGG